MIAVAVDIKTNQAVSLEVTNDRTHDGEMRRWMVETFFSGFKRLFGEVVHAKRWERMVKEIELKVWIYNLMLGLGPGSLRRGILTGEGGRGVS